jgi:dipeptidase
MYSYMIQDVRAVQSELEGGFLARQAAVEKAATELAQTAPEEMVRYLTQYSVSQAEEVVGRWRELGELLIVKYNDGYINGRSLGYPEEWLRRVLLERPLQFIIPHR